MDTLKGTALTRGDVLPGTALVDVATGRQVRVWDFRGRIALVLCFLHAGCHRCEGFARDLAGNEREIGLTGSRA